MNENLVGYLLQALDEPEQRAVEADLRSQPAQSARLDSLRTVLAPLALDAEPPAPPPHLTISTLALIAEHRCPSMPSLPLPPALPLRQSGGRQWVRRVDLLVAACLLVVIGGLSLPLIAQLWYQAQRTACQGNLRQFWGALQTYCDSNNNAFPQISERGPHNYAGSFVGKLHEAGCMPAGNNLMCQGVGGKDLPATEGEVDRLDGQPEFTQRARQLAGHYAYSLGYWQDGKLHGLKPGDHQPILADHRPEETVGTNSPNHRGRGQNVLSVGGNVWFATSPYLTPGDNMYLNRNGKTQAGVDHDDTVLGSGETRP